MILRERPDLVSFEVAVSVDMGMQPVHRWIFPDKYP